MVSEITRRSLILVTILVTLSAESDSQACTSGGRSGIRLQNGRNQYEGLVEVCDDGRWKTVCNEGWDKREAEVTCRQLGFSGDLNPTEENDGFGQGSDGILRKRWRCTGSEENLLECLTDGRSMHQCGHDDDAGVYCFGEDPAVCDSSSESTIRLVGGTSDGSSGRVEVCLNGLWGTVCDDGWDTNDATIVCRQLGFTNITHAIPTSRAYFGEGQGPIHLSRAGCESTDAYLTECADNTGINDCEHREDAGVICQGSASCIDEHVRLEDGSDEREGRVEICYNGVWGTVCDTGWDEVDASVVCRQLGYGTIATPVNNSGAGDGPILFTNVSCTHSNSLLSQCIHITSIGQHNCDIRNTAGVICHKEKENEATTTATVSENKTHSSNGQQATIIGATVGVLTTVIISVIVVILLVIVAVMIVKRKSKAVRDKKESMDNPTYDENIIVQRLPPEPQPQAQAHQPNTTEQRQQNPQQSNYYKSLSRDTMNSENVYHVLEQPTTNREEMRSSLEATYAVPEDAMPGACDDNCYSALGPADYSILEPHLSGEVRQQPVVVQDDDYSRLQHI